MGERLLRMQEVVGPIPIISTISFLFPFAVSLILKVCLELLKPNSRLVSYSDLVNRFDYSDIYL